jgi:hypothetical protein
MYLHLRFMANRCMAFAGNRGPRLGDGVCGIRATNLEKEGIAFWKGLLAVSCGWISSVALKIPSSICEFSLRFQNYFEAGSFPADSRIWRAR